jgi:tetratricopeptide (TPR) repeat protein
MEQPSAPVSALRYRAFVSYSHADAEFASWLHRKIETYRLPAGSADPGGRLSPVFIDRAELPAAPDLSAQVKEALASSAALIVIASPNAKASRWVGQEIALFRSLHPVRPVFAALIDGEPDEAFPDALTSHRGQPIEPLAADFRKGADGKRLGLLKIIAGLTGQPLDRLIQRDAQSRQRRVMVVTAATMALSVILAALLVVALQARAEAERQRASAEGMVEFMLTDLRDRLKGVGRLDVMDAVNERALAHYAGQSLEGLNADALNRRARTLLALGEDSSRRGNFKEARMRYQEAHRTTGAVLKQRPADPSAIFAHGQSEYWLGYAAWEQLDLQATDGHWRGYLTQAEALAKREPGALRSEVELGFATGNLCELEMRRSQKVEAALPWCERSSSHMRKATSRTDATAQTWLELANRLGWQADVLGAAKRTDQALTLRREEATIIDRLQSSDPGNQDLRERRLWPETGAAKLELDAGRLDSGLVRIDQVLSDYAKLAAGRPDDRNLTAQQFRAAWLAGKFAMAADHPSAARFVARSRAFHAILRRSYSPAEMARFDRMLAKLNRGDV